MSSQPAVIEDQYRSPYSLSQEGDDDVRQRSVEPERVQMGSSEDDLTSSSFVFPYSHYRDQPGSYLFKEAGDHNEHNHYSSGEYEPCRLPTYSEVEESQRDEDQNGLGDFQKIDRIKTEYIDILEIRQEAQRANFVGPIAKPVITSTPVAIKTEYIDILEGRQEAQRAIFVGPIAKPVITSTSVALKPQNFLREYKLVVAGGCGVGRSELAIQVSLCLISQLKITC